MSEQPSQSGSRELAKIKKSVLKALTHSSYYLREGVFMNEFLLLAVIMIYVAVRY
jgi:hypothetical protein